MSTVPRVTRSYDRESVERKKQDPVARKNLFESVLDKKSNIKGINDSTSVWV